MRKKPLIFCLVLVLSISVGLSGCANQEPAPTDSSNSSETHEETQELFFATGGTAGTYYPLGGAISSIWNENIPAVNITIQPSGASLENIRLLDSGEADIIMSMNNIAEDAWLGKGSFEGSQVQGFRAVGVIYPEIIQGVGLVDSGIKTITDQIGKRVAGGPPGSGTAATTPHIFAAYGLSDEDMTVVNDTFGDAVEKMKDGHLDAAWNVIAAPGAAIVDLLTTKELYFLEIQGKELDELQEQFPLIAPHVIPAGTYNYKGKDYPDIHTIALQAVLYVRDDMDEELVYNLAKYMYEKNDEIAKIHGTGSQISLENAKNGITTDFHPGAIKYYTEKGMWN